MRVVVMANAASPHTARWSCALADRGWDVHVLSIRGGSIPGTTVHRVGFGNPNRRSKLLAGLSYCRLLLTARRLVARVEPDIVHAHYSVTHGVIAILTRLRPVVVTVWGSDLVRGNRVVGGPKRWINRFVFRRATAITAASGFLVDAVRSVVGSSVPIHQVPFGVDTDAFAPRTNERRGPFTIGFVKQLRDRYDPTMLVDAFARLHSPGSRLLMVGSGPLKRRLRRRVARLGIGDRVEFRDGVPHEDVADLMRELDVLVNPSRSEAFGVVVAEASATGLPVIATVVGGIREVVEDGTTGLLVPVGDVDALAGALDRLAADSDLRARMGRDGRIFVLSRYRWERCVDRMVTVLSEAAS